MVFATEKHDKAVVVVGLDKGVSSPSQQPLSSFKLSKCIPHDSQQAQERWKTETESSHKMMRTLNTGYHKIIHGKVQVCRKKNGTEEMEGN